jgi:hypothetical protein
VVKRVEPAMAENADPFPSPPFPDPDNEILRLIITHAVGAYQAGEVDVAGAITHAAVHSWYEGHIQGEDACPGCNYRGDLPKQRRQGWLPPGSNDELTVGFPDPLGPDRRLPVVSTPSTDEST